MNKKQNLLAIALSASFVLGGANVAQADEETPQLASQQIEDKAQVQNLAKETAGAVDNQSQSPTAANNISEIAATEANARATDDKNTEAINQEAGTPAEPAASPASINPVDPSAPTSENNTQTDTNQAESKANNQSPQTAEGAPLEVAEEKAPEAQRAANEPNYTEDEKKIEDYSKDERYKETDLQPGDTKQSLGNTDEMVEKDGFKFELKNPSETSPSKREYGYEITIDKKTGQRTYTKVTVTDSGLIPVNPGNKPMMKEGDKLTPESPGVIYKPTENT